MSNIASWFTWNRSITSWPEELPEIYPLPITSDIFVQNDVINIYSKILTDVVERTHGLSDEEQALLWDNALKSASSDGVVTLLAKAMTNQSDLYLVYEKAVGVVRKATGQEQQRIRTDYEKGAKSEVGLYISFRNFGRSDIVRFYSALEFATVAGLYKSVNLSKAIQFKMSNLRGDVALRDSDDIVSQASKIASALGKGRDVMIDAGDTIATAIPDLTAVKASIDFLNQKRSFYLGLPEAYITGIQTGGLGTSGEQDTKAIERGLKGYYFSIVKPVLETLFETKLTYKSQDFRQLGQALEALKTFELTGEEYLSAEQKKKIVEGLLDIDADENQTTREATGMPARDVATRVAVGVTA